MKFEADAVTLLAGFRHGETLGSPIAIQVGNTEWPKWQQVMAPGRWMRRPSPASPATPR
ncbi:chorismate synthase [Tessaracoccus sp. HDW20]|nr:chorismate synthase [Tessaracoccus coleopterorum]